MKKINIIAAVGIAIVLCVTACFSPWDDSDGKGSIAINMDNSSARFAVTDSEKAGLEYTVTLTSEGKIPVKKSFMGGSAVISVSPGTWNVEIRAVGNTPDEYFPILADGYFSERMLRGLGEAVVEVKAGSTTQAPVKMVTATEVHNFEEFQFAFDNADPTGKPEIILVAGNIDATSLLYIGSNNKKQDITLRAEKNVAITKYNDNGEPIFWISEDGTFTLDGRGGNITLQGSSIPTPDPLISINSGTLIMHDGVTLTGNHTITAAGSNTYGGGVFMSWGATFIMNGGTISDNTVSSGGGGVSMDSGSTFTMNGGTISGNTVTNSNGNGGGVFVVSDGTSVSTFIMNGGTISGNTAGLSGGGVMVGDYATFTMNGGTISGNTATNGNGGGVCTDMRGPFMMKGGTISGNTAKNMGGGVYAEGGGTFAKTGGTIYGSEASEENKNVANAPDNPSYPNSNGHAVFYNFAMYRNTTAGPGVNLDSTIGDVNWNQ